MTINQKMYEQVELLREQNELISKLEGCLDLILSNNKSEDSDLTESKKQNGNSQLYKAVEDCNEKIYFNSMRIKSLILRLDLDGDGP